MATSVKLFWLILTQLHRLTRHQKYHLIFVPFTTYLVITLSRLSKYLSRHFSLDSIKVHFLLFYWTPCYVSYLRPRTPFTFGTLQGHVKVHGLWTLMVLRSDVGLMRDQLSSVRNKGVTCPPFGTSPSLLLRSCDLPQTSLNNGSIS